MEKIVYILGAGFSAPLGLPVMSNFLQKSKDLYFNNIEKYKHFDSVFNDVQRLSFIKNYYESDLFNIEEILSILEMEKLTNPSRKTTDFIKYIADVIEAYTPKIKNISDSKNDAWFKNLFSHESLLNSYGTFVSEMMNLKYINTGSGFVVARKKENFSSAYNVISLNYDLVIENFIDKIVGEYDYKANVVSSIEDESVLNYNNFHYAKLHGCISKGNIIPPTWSKTSNSEIANTWKLAAKLLSEANQIRIIGFSLPRTDSYLKYLFKTAILGSDNLKKIDVMNLDPSFESKDRYDEFISFKNYSYTDINSRSYLDAINGYFINAYNNLNDKYSKDYKIDNISAIEHVHNR